MERRRQRVFFSDPDTWIPFDPSWCDTTQHVTETTIYNALTDSEMLADLRDRVLTSADKKTVEKARKQIREEYR